MRRLLSWMDRPFLNSGIGLLVKNFNSCPLRRFVVAALFVLSLAVLPACKTTPPQPPLVETIAVLPFDSESNNIDSNLIMQRLVYLALEPSVYRVTDYKETNAKLLEMGIQEGGQLAALDPTKIGKDLGVHALMYGNVETFGYLNVGVYVSQKVTLELKLIDVTTGETLWQNSGSRATRRIAWKEEDIKKNFAKGLATQLVDKMFNTPLQKEAEGATVSALAKLPGFRFRGFAKDEESKDGKRAVKGTIKDAINKQ